MGIELDIPRWRKVVFLSGFVLTLVLGGVLANKEFDIYVSSAKSPRANTGEIYAVCVNHGAVRYARTMKLGRHASAFPCYPRFLL